MVLSYWPSGLKSVIYLPVNAILGLRLKQMIRMHRICDTVKHLVVSAIRCSGLQCNTLQIKTGLIVFFLIFRKIVKHGFYEFCWGITVFQCSAVNGNLIHK